VGASSWQCVEPYAGDVAAALATVRQREFERLSVLGTPWDGQQPAGQSSASVDDLDDLWEDETFGGAGTHTIIDVWQVIDAEAYDDSHTVMRWLRCSPLRRTRSWKPSCLTRFCGHPSLPKGMLEGLGNIGRLYRLGLTPEPPYGSRPFGRDCKQVASASPAAHEVR
jgi:hypothetical protein